MFTLAVHQFQADSQMRRRLVRTTPYLRLTANGNPPVFLQEGQFYSEGGSPIKEVPAWIPEALETCSPDALREVGYLPPAGWTCDECGEAMDLNRKGTHIARHRKADKHGDKSNS